jgi:DNA-binding transcriptional ArsR family regulator
MHTPPPYLEPEEPLEPTAFDDLVSSCRCDTRYAILCSLLAGPLHVTAIVELLGRAQPHVSNHLRLLRGGKLVVAEQRKRNRFYSLGSGIRWSREPGRTQFMMRSDDGCDMVLGVPDTAEPCRQFTPALWARLKLVTPAPNPAVIVVPGAEVRTPPPRGKTPPHPPTKP